MFKGNPTSVISSFLIRNSSWTKDQLCKLLKKSKNKQTEHVNMSKQRRKVQTNIMNVAMPRFFLRSKSTQACAAAVVSTKT
jgi:hypothetical protein